MDSPNIPAATLSPVFSSEAPPKLVGYSVVVEDAWSIWVTACGPPWPWKSTVRRSFRSDPCIHPDNSHLPSMQMSNGWEK